MSTVTDPLAGTETEPTQQPAVTAFATAPILLRSTYPPGQPPLGYAPKPLRRSPQSAADIMFPGSLQGTLFQGPIISGPTPGVNGAVAATRLTLSLQIDWSMGNFNVPILFPGGSFLLSITSVSYETYATAPVILLGTQSGQGDIQAVTVTPINVGPTPQPVMVQLPLWNAAAPLVPFTAWLGVSGNTGATAGGVIVLIDYVRVPSPWSVPATNFNRPGQ